MEISKEIIIHIRFQGIPTVKTNLIISFLNKFLNKIQNVAIIIKKNAKNPLKGKFYK